MAGCPWSGQRPWQFSRPLPLPCRLQRKLALLQQQCEEKQQLFQSLQSELQIYEALYGSSKKGLKGKCFPCPVSSLPLAWDPHEVLTLGVVELWKATEYCLENPSQVWASQ